MKRLTIEQYRTLTMHAAHVVLNRAETAALISCADDLLTDGVYHDAILAVADLGRRPPIARERVILEFTVMLGALGFTLPTDDNALWIVLQDIVVRISDSALSARDGLDQIIDLYWAGRAEHAWSLEHDPYGVMPFVALQTTEPESGSALRHRFKRDQERWENEIVARARAWLRSHSWCWTGPAAYTEFVTRDRTGRPPLYLTHGPRDHSPHAYRPDSVLDYDSAIIADVPRQQGSISPRIWYIDARQSCVQCGEMFLFSADEQRHWYEVLRFNTSSYPTRCRACRRDQRVLKAARQRYGEIHGDAVRRDAPRALKEQVIDILDHLRAAGDRISDRMEACRALLVQQLERDAEHGSPD